MQRHVRCGGHQEEFGINTHTNLLVQYLQYWGDLFHGNLGVSYFEGSTPVTTLIGQYLPWTIGLLGVATVISFVLGTLIGIVLGWRRGSRLDWVVPGATFFQAIPYFFLAMVLIELFASILQLVPPRIRVRHHHHAGMELPLHREHHRPLHPAGAHGGAGIDRRVHPGHAQPDADHHGRGLRPAGAGQGTALAPGGVVRGAQRDPPSISNFSLAISLVVAGQLLVEVVFNYPGIGYLLYKAVINHDYPLVQGVFVVIVVVVLAANLIADVVYAFVDPRARQEA